MHHRKLLISLAITFVLAACGGGGSNSSTDTSSGQGASSSSSSSSGGTSSSSSSSSGGFSPEAGSTMDVGNGREGVWIFANAQGDSKIMLVDSSDSLFYLSVKGGTTTDGSITGQFNSLGSGSNLWSINNGLYIAPPNTAGVFAQGQATGGFFTFSDLKTINAMITGHFIASAPDTSDFALIYYMQGLHEANSHAVTQSSLEGTWGSLSIGVQIDATGTLIGLLHDAQLGNCTLAGTITHIDNGATKKDLFNVALTAQDSGDGTCKLRHDGSFNTGLATILFGSGSQQLIFSTQLIGNPGYFSSGTLFKQTVTP